MFDIYGHLRKETGLREVVSQISLLLILQFRMSSFQISFFSGCEGVMFRKFLVFFLNRVFDGFTPYGMQIE